MDHLNSRSGLDFITHSRFAIDVGGSLKSGLDFSTTINGQLSLVAYRTLAASLAFNATIGDYTQKPEIISEDDLFDDKKSLVKVNYDACQVVDVIQSLLGKLVLLLVSPQSILGPSALSGVSFFDPEDTTGTLDSLFPDVGQFMNGVLEAKK
mmetsp:Transcript_11185/g.20473  ORF Transcript_11185/g.20473 Transcript_11185/m.20473 type:complete len:152 (-) Transcript_11185:979-1434(-)